MTHQEFAAHPAISKTWSEAGPVVCRMLAEQVIAEAASSTKLDASAAVAQCARLRALAQLHQIFSRVGLPDTAIADRPKMQALQPED